MQASWYLSPGLRHTPARPSWSVTWPAPGILWYLSPSLCHTLARPLVWSKQNLDSSVTSLGVQSVSPVHVILGPGQSSSSAFLSGTRMQGLLAQRSWTLLMISLPPVVLRRVWAEPNRFLPVWKGRNRSSLHELVLVVCHLYVVSRLHQTRGTWSKPRKQYYVIHYARTFATWICVHPPSSIPAQETVHHSTNGVSDVAALLVIGADPGRNTTWGRGSEGRPEALSGSRTKPWWGSRGRSPRRLLNFRGFIGLKTFLPRSHFNYISVIINGDKLIKWRKIYNFLKYEFSLQK
jgi:hypothetical protein